MPEVPDTGDTVLVTVQRQASDFDAYVALNQRLRTHMAPRAMAEGGLAGALRLAVMFFAGPLLIVAGLALWWGTGPERVPDLVSVFLIA